MAQMNLNQNLIGPAVKILMGIEKLKNKPAMVSTIVSLQKQMNDIDGAIQFLDDVIMSMTDKDTHYIAILRGNADLKMECGRYADATTVYKKLLSLDKGNTEILLLLATAYAYCDVEKAKEIEKQLPPLEGSLQMTAEELENLPVILPTITKKKDENNVIIKEEKQLVQDKKSKRKRKKKKNKLPKNYNPKAQPDPDRWKPKHLRAGYRGKKKKASK